MQSNVVKSEVLNTVVQSTEPIPMGVSIQLFLPKEGLSLMILKKLENMENKLLVYANNINYLENKMVKLTEVLHDTNERLKTKDTVLTNIPQWHTVSAVAKVKGLSSDAVRKQLQNGEFEDGVDFKKPDGTILINQGAIERIQRKRRNSDA